jgi:hypothetical protein
MMMLLFRSLLALYPSAHRREYGDEMTAVLAAVHADITQKGLLAKAIAYAREVSGLLHGAFQEHARSFLLPQGCSFYPRRFLMRSEFRFPKSTVALMSIILAAVIMTIEKAKAISESVPPANPTVGPIQAEHFTTVSTLLVVLAGMAIAGAILWAVLFGLRRSGIQRLAELETTAGHPTKSNLIG